MSKEKWKKPVGDLFEEYLKTRSIEIRNKLIIHYLRSAKKIALKYGKIYGLEEEEAIDIGYEGLIKAIENYNLKHRSKPQTYIESWIARLIVRKTISNPEFKKKLYLAFPKYKKEVEQEMSKDYNGDIEMLEMILDKMIADGLIDDSSSVREEFRIALRQLSTEEIKGTKDDIYSDDYLEENLDKKILTEDIYPALDALNDEEKEIIRMRYGLDDGKAKTLVEVARTLNVTSEHVKAVEAKALKKIRYNLRLIEINRFKEKR